MSPMTGSTAILRRPNANRCRGSGRFLRIRAEAHDVNSVLETAEAGTIEYNAVGRLGRQARRWRCARSRPSDPACILSDARANPPAMLPPPILALRDIHYRLGEQL